MCTFSQLIAKAMHGAPRTGTVAALLALLVSISLHVTAQQTAKPEFSVGTGVYSSAQNVTITDATPGATICYTTNGGYPYYVNFTPTCDGNLYSGPITISDPETLAAVALAPGSSVSEGATAEFLFGTDATRLIYTVAGEIPGYSGDGGPATSAKLSFELLNTAVDGDGNLYIADAGNSRIRKVAATTGIITTVAGNGISGYSGDNGLATSAEIGECLSVAVDAAGNIYIADCTNGVIRKITALTGVITTVAGNGTLGYSGDSGPATSAELRPGLLAVDNSANFYIEDSQDSVIRRVTASTGIITTVVGNGKSGYSGDGGPAINAELGGPDGLALDSAGNLYIADTGNNVIRKVAATTGIINTIAGNGIGTPSYYCNGGPATSAVFLHPSGSAVDSVGNLYFAGGEDGPICMIAAATGLISQVTGRDCDLWSSGDGGPASSAAVGCNVGGPTIDSVGNLYFSTSDASWNVDWTSFRSAVRMVTATTFPPLTATAAPQFSIPTGNYTIPQMVTISDSTPGAAIHYTTDGSKPDTASYVYTGPININGNVTINAMAIAPSYLPSAVTTENYDIAASPIASIWTVAGKGKMVTTGGYSGDGGPAISAELSYPSGLAFDSAGNLYISDYRNNRVREVNASTGIITTIVGKGSGGYGGDGGLAPSAELDGPSGLAFDSADNLYIADSGNNRVRKVTASTGIITTIVGNGTAGYSGDNGPATSAELYQPNGIVVDAAGNLYIADTVNLVIRKVTAATGIITTVAGHGTGGYYCDGCQATSTLISYPQSIAVDSASNLYILDSFYSVIRKVTAMTGIISTVVGNGHVGDNADIQIGYSGDNGPPSSAELGHPTSIALDSAGDLYIADMLNNVIRMVTANMETITTVVGNGVGGYGGDGGSAALAEINVPQVVGVDAKGNLYIADWSYNVIREVGRGTGVGQITPSVTVTPSSFGITTAQTLTVTVAVSGGPGAPTPTGSVTLTGGGYTSTATTLTIGSATISIPAGSLATGSDTLTVAYTPYAASSSTYSSASGSASVKVTTFTLSGTTVTVAPGATTGNTSTITITPGGGFTGSVALTAAITSSPTGAQYPPTLSFGSTTPVSITGTTAGTATLTISTTAASSGCSSAYLMQKSVPWYAPGSAVLACLLLFGIPARRRKSLTMLGIFALLIALSGGVLACGGGGGGGGCTVSSIPGTTPGAYTITVTGKSSTLTATGTVALTVQ